MKLHERCERCGTKRFKKKTDGTLVCKNGHLRLGWQEEIQEDGMVFMKSRRKIASQHSDTSGMRERFKGIDRDCVRWQICQKGLNLLVEHCARELHFPEHIQTIALHLWVLYVSRSDKTLDFDIFDMDKEKEPAAPPIQPAVPTAIEDEFNINFSVSDDDQEQIEDDEQQEEEEEQYEWPALRYSDITVFLFLTFKLAGLPVLFSDIRRWCKSQQIPYFEALLNIPKPVLLRVDKAFIYTTQRMPSVHKLHQRARLYRKGFEKLCGVSFPDANVPGLLHRLYPHFGLPDVFRGHALVLLDKMQELARSGKLFIFDAYDEVQAVVCMVVLVKFLYILDDKPKGMREATGKYTLPSPPLKKDAMKALRTELNRLRASKKKSDLAQIDASRPAQLAFLRSFSEALKGAGYIREDIVLVGEESRKPPEANKSQDDILYLCPQKHPDKRAPVEKALAKRQLHYANTVYPLDHMRQHAGQSSIPELPKEYRTVLKLAASLVDLDINRLHCSLARFEHYIKDDYLH